MTNYRNIGFDVLVHGQDIAIPLGRDHPMPAEAARAGADRVWTMGWPFWARRRLRGVRLLATDTDWSAGVGVELRGPIKMLLLLLTGRTTAALPHLSGPGVHTITERFVLPRAEADQADHAAFQQNPRGPPALTTMRRLQMYGVITTVPAPVEMYDGIHAEMIKRVGMSVDGLLVHVGRATTEGFQTVEVWESKEHYDRANTDIVFPLMWELAGDQPPCPRSSKQRKPSTYAALSFPAATS